MLPIHCDHPQVLGFHINGDVPGEPCDEMLLAFNAAETAEVIGLPEGQWKLCISGDKAGLIPMATMENFLVIPPVSAMVLVKGNVK